MNKTYLGIDNGTSGSLSVIYPDGKWKVRKTPIIIQQSYTKKIQNISRIDFPEMMKLLASVKKNANKYKSQLRIFLERPAIDGRRFKTAISAARSLEATLIIFEILGLSFEYIDSKQWQKKMLPHLAKVKNKKGDKKKVDTKKLSLEIGERLFPGSRIGNDCDAILIAEWSRREKL